MQNKKPLAIGSVATVVCAEVQRHFKGRLPRGWHELVLAAVQPRDLMICSTPSELGELFYKCFTDDADLTLKILNYARACGRKYIAENCETQAELVRAMLLCERETDLFHGAPQPISAMSDKETAEWINSNGFRTKVTAASVRTARQAIGKSRGPKK